jgi:hypothetical protein
MINRWDEVLRNVMKESNLKQSSISARNKSRMNGLGTTLNDPSWQQPYDINLIEAIKALLYV